MAEVELDAQLARNLALIFLVTNLFLLHDFHATQKTSLFMLNKHDLSKLSFAQLFANGKIILLKFNILGNFHMIQLLNNMILLNFLRLFEDKLLIRCLGRIDVPRRCGIKGLKLCVLSELTNVWILLFLFEHSALFCW